MVPTKKQKVDGLRVVFYEMHQMLASAGLTKEIGEAKSHVEENKKNAFVESMLVHVRGLIEFFESTTRVKDTILASDYGFSCKSVGVDKKYVDRLNKDLCHITFDRLKRRLADDKSWPRDEVVLPVIQRSIEFIELVPDDQLAGTEIRLEGWHDLLNLLRTTAVEIKNVSEHGVNTTTSTPASRSVSFVPPSGG